MSKVKINCTNGVVIEKPLVSCFQGAKGNYIIIDNEANGSMGLPIICISKFDGTNLVKVLDQAEWTSVKETLKTIIAGTNPTYLAVPDTLTAGDDFYTQLTLPVASFDVIKAAYAPASAPAPAEPAPVAETPAAPAPETAVPAPEAPVEAQAPTLEAPASLGAAPVIDLPAAPALPETAPVVPEAPAAPAEPAPVVETPAAPAPTEIPAIPAIPSVPSIEEVAAKVEENKTSEPVTTDTPAPAEPAPLEAPAAPILEAPAVPTAEPTAPAAPAADTISITAPVVEETPASAPVEDIATMDPASMMAAPEAPAAVPVAPTISNDAIALPTEDLMKSPIVEPDDIAALKETFMKSCETMFDALLQKFQEHKN